MSVENASKKRKLDSFFHPGLFESEQNLSADYAKSTPYLHSVIPQLFDRDFLLKARKEIVSQLVFTEKQTDIYKINQTGDLANLSGLAEDEISLLPTLLELRNSIYSQKFRDFLRKITGCGPLSGSKMDMSINAYRSGNYLLNHDDVIGSRRISFILYIPIPSTNSAEGGSNGWKPDWGGALELYPLDPQGIFPDTIPAKSIPPAFNQFAFFEVQPGHSFHSVEEVVVDSIPGDIGERLSISGWFHRPVEGEDGWQEDQNVTNDSLKAGLKLSSLQALQGAEVDTFVDCPTTSDNPLTPDDISFLSKFITADHLSSDGIKNLADSFAEASHISIPTFLRNEKLSLILQEIEALNKNAGLFRTQRRNTTGIPHTKIPKHDCDIGDWKIRGPPHIRRYCSLTDQHVGSEKSAMSLLENFLSSSSFHQYLRMITSLNTPRYTMTSRLFRPGLDYTLARGSGSESRLDLHLGLTNWDLQNKNGDQDVGGWECYMSAEDSNDDPAVYKRSVKVSETKVGEESDNDGDDETLLVITPTLNQLTLVLVDPDVLKFTKYLCSEAESGLVDISAEFQLEPENENEHGGD